MPALLNREFTWPPASTFYAHLYNEMILGVCFKNFSSPSQFTRINNNFSSNFIKSFYSLRVTFLTLLSISWYFNKALIFCVGFNSLSICHSYLIILDHLNNTFVDWNKMIRAHFMNDNKAQNFKISKFQFIQLETQIGI